PLTAMLIMVTRERCPTVAPARSLASPAQTQPTAPAAMTKKATASEECTHGGTQPAGTRCRTGFPAASHLRKSGPLKITAIHAHMEYSSHMWPRYPKLARRSFRLRNV